MYYVVYSLLKLISWIPLKALYLLGDFVYFLLYYVTGYRKKVVLQNLQIAFPDKTDAERKKIAKEFYHNFCDNFLEMLKLLSWDEKEIRNHMRGNADILNMWAGKQQGVQVITGHFFNWEIANLVVGSQSKLPFLVVYMPLSNKIMDEIVYDIRQKTGTILISAVDFKNEVSEHMKKQYALILAGDQNPRNPANAYWLNFFSKPAPFVKGPERGAMLKNSVVVYIDFYKVKRGYYNYELKLITDDPSQMKEGELTKLLVQKIEDSIRKRPSNYLWSHRRWKHNWKQEYSSLWVDEEAMPVAKKITADLLHY